MPLTEERVRAIVDAVDAVERGDVDGHADYLPVFEERRRLAADWLALRAQNAALRAMVEEAYFEGAQEGKYRVCDWPGSEARARLAALGEP